MNQTSYCIWLYLCIASQLGQTKRNLFLFSGRRHCLLLLLWSLNFCIIWQCVFYKLNLFISIKCSIFYKSFFLITAGWARRRRRRKQHAHTTNLDSFGWIWAKRILFMSIKWIFVFSFNSTIIKTVIEIDDVCIERGGIVFLCQ